MAYDEEKMRRLDSYPKEIGNKMKNIIILLSLVSTLACGDKNTVQPLPVSPENTVSDVAVAFLQGKNLVKSTKMNRQKNFAKIQGAPVPAPVKYVQYYLPYFFKPERHQLINVMKPSLLVEGCDSNDVRLPTVSRYDKIYSYGLDDGKVEGKRYQISAGYGIREKLYGSDFYTLTIAFRAPATCREVSVEFEAYFEN